ncbi:MAG: DUF2513 domain-containing protein [Campylobacterota bacterium]|nr:DUF2513 domain-containing protein [Campylobacterota bacterium]
MKRYMELVRKLLLAIEENPNIDKIEGYDDETIRYHQALLIEADLVKGKITDGGFSNPSSAPMFVYIERLTWNGHEFLDNVRQDTVWNTIKSEFKNSSFKTITKVGKELAENYAKKKLEDLLNASSQIK